MSREKQDILALLLLIISAYGTYISLVEGLTSSSMMSFFTDFSRPRLPWSPLPEVKEIQEDLIKDYGKKAKRENRWLSFWSIALAVSLTGVIFSIALFF